MSAKKEIKPKEIVLAFQKAWNAQDLKGVAATFHPDLVYHHGDRDMNAKDFIEFAPSVFVAFPDQKYDIVKIIEEGDSCAVIYHWTGTNTGEFMGNPPTNKKVDYLILEVDIIKDGLFYESWARLDTLDMMRQLGFM
jgi:predicted ester cyclase